MIVVPSADTTSVVPYTAEKLRVMVEPLADTDPAARYLADALLPGSLVIAG